MSTKIHALVEGLDNLARWEVTGGQVHDVTQAQTLLSGVSAQAVIADKAFDSDALIHLIVEGGGTAVIRPNPIGGFSVISIASNTNIVTSLSVSSVGSNNFVAARLAMTNLPAAFPRSSH